MRTWAIIVGINEYPANANQRVLNGAVADAIDFADWALHPNGGNVDPSRLYLWTYPAPPPGAATPAVAAHLAAPTPWWSPNPPGRAVPTDRAPTMMEIFQTAYLAAQDALTLGNEDGEESRCYILLAGHGVQAKVIGSTMGAQTCFLAGDFQTHGAITGLLPTLDLRDGLLVHGFTEVFLFLDCCRLSLTRYNAQVAQLPFPMGRFRDKPRWGIGWAADPDSIAWETPHDAPTRGAFTKILVEGLRQVRDPQTNRLSVYALEAYVSNRIADAVAPKEQWPIILGEPNSRRLVIVEAPAIPLEPNAATAPVVVNCQRVPPGTALRLLDTNDVEIAQFASNGGAVTLQVQVGQPYTIESADGAFEKGFLHGGPGESHVDL